MALVLRDISHCFGDLKAVDGVSLNAEAGEIVSLFGHSGCGKTTLLRIAAGLEPLQSGTVELEGHMIAAPDRETPPEKRSIGFVFQDFVLFPHMTVEENVAFGLPGVSDRRARVSAQLEALSLAALARRYPHELSGGQQQRTALARALVRKPKALLLDEPFASIDAVLRRRLREELRGILKEQNVAVILVTHDPEEALSIGDKIALMRAGRIIEAATPLQLFESPKTPEGAGIFPGRQSLSGVISAEKLATAAGEFPAKGLADGPGVAVLGKGALSAFKDASGAFYVADARFKGPGWAARIEGREGPVNLWVEMSEAPVIGEIMTIAADLDKTFVFSNQ